MSGPYFKGQKPAGCGHYYPDVLKVGDIKKSGDVIRIVDCKYCGRTEITLDPSYRIDAKDIGKLLSDEEIVKSRKKELERLLK